MINLNEIKETIKQDLITAYKEVINENGLVDTGLLRDSVEVEIEGYFNITLSTQNYYKYLDKGTIYIQPPYDITEQLLQHPLWSRSEEYIEDAITLIIENSLFKDKE